MVDHSKSIVEQMPQSNEVSDASQIGMQQDEIHAAKDILRTLLREYQGSVSTRVFKKSLDEKGIVDSSLLISRLKYTDEGAVEFHHIGRSFYSPQQYEREVETRKQDAGEAEEAAEEVIEDTSVLLSSSRENRKDEARLCAYVKDALNDLYGTEYGPDVDYVFDVHDKRPGSEFENVDILAIDWRSDQHIEIVAVEVKLDFSVKAVHQAINYGRFADRTWIAVTIAAEPTEAGAALRDSNSLLFDYVVDQGLGILACRPRQGRSYSIFPVHWPRLTQNDPFCRQNFRNQYRSVLEEAGVIAPEVRAYPIV